MDKIVPPSKKRRYKLLEQKGQRSKILIALLKGKENSTTLSRKLKHKAKKTPYVARYMQKLRENQLLEIDPIEGKTQKGNFTKNIGNKLNLCLFFIGYANENSEIVFDKKEIIILGGLFQILEREREDLIIECIWNNDGSIFTTLLIRIMMILLDKKNLHLLTKFYGLYKKCYVLARNQPFSQELYHHLIKLEPLIYNFYEGDLKFEDYVNKHVQSINEGVCVKNKDKRIQEFCDSLIPINKFEMKDGHCVRMRELSKKEFEISLKQTYDQLKRIKENKGERKFVEYFNKMNKLMVTPVYDKKEGPPPKKITPLEFYGLLEKKFRKKSSS